MDALTNKEVIMTIILTQELQDVSNAYQTNILEKGFKGTLDCFEIRDQTYKIQLFKSGYKATQTWSTKPSRLRKIVNKWNRFWNNSTAINIQKIMNNPNQQLMAGQYQYAWAMSRIPDHQHFPRPVMRSFFIAVEDRHGAYYQLQILRPPRQTPVLRPSSVSGMLEPSMLGEVPDMISLEQDGTQDETSQFALNADDADLFSETHRSRECIDAKVLGNLPEPLSPSLSGQ